ncbi:hypothetical protein O1L44_29880 [Streptomyces noursei]|nr:hypothetical protein [Streptomyces noursei]
MRLPVAVHLDNAQATFTPAEPPTPTYPPPGDGAPYDPSDHPVKDVLAYLEGVGEEEAMRVLQAEENAENPARASSASARTSSPAPAQTTRPARRRRPRPRAAAAAAPASRPAEKG